MEVYASEQEQVEAIKEWWKENGRAVILGVALALAAVFGWKTWQNHVRTQATLASNDYQMLLDNLNAGDTRQVTEMGRRIVGDFPNTVYAVLASLSMAQQAVDQNDLDGAAAHLRWAAEHSKLPELKALARVRLARLLIAQGKSDAALQELAGEKLASFTALADETRGDAYLQQGKRSEAYKAYNDALAGYADVPSKQQLLRMKIDDLADAAGAAKQ